MAHKINENCQKNDTDVAKPLVSVSSTDIDYSNRTSTDRTLSISSITDDAQKKNPKKFCKNLINIKDGFSWKIIAGYNVPYIIRLVNGKHLKFVATRMAECQLLKKYLYSIHSKMYAACTPIIAYPITESEVKILNYINEKHYGLGKEYQYLAGIDYIVRLEDIHNFYLFLKICYKKLLCNVTSGYKAKCGFISINSSCGVPYCTQDGQKYLPAFYFQSIPDDLKQRAVKIENWNFAYLKFCFRLHGISGKFYASDSCLGVSLDDIKNLYPPETDFKDFWPAKLANLCLSTNWKAFQTKPYGSWFRTAPKVVPDQNTILHSSTSTKPMIPHGTQVKMSQMQQQQKQQQQQQINNSPQIQADDNSNNAAYQIQIATLEGKTIHCINAKPRIYSDLMVTLKDLVGAVLPLCNVAKCAHILHKYLKTTLLFGESEQLAVLLENKLIKSMNPGDTPMAMLKDVAQVLPLLKVFVVMRDEEIEQYQSADGPYQFLHII